MLIGARLCRPRACPEDLDLSESGRSRVHHFPATADRCPIDANSLISARLSPRAEHAAPWVLGTSPRMTSGVVAVAHITRLSVRAAPAQFFHTLRGDDGSGWPRHVQIRCDCWRGRANPRLPRAAGGWLAGCVRARGG